MCVLCDEDIDYTSESVSRRLCCMLRWSSQRARELPTLATQRLMLSGEIPVSLSVRQSQKVSTKTLCRRHEEKKMVKVLFSSGAGKKIKQTWIFLLLLAKNATVS